MGASDRRCLIVRARGGAHQVDEHAKRARVRQLCRSLAAQEEVGQKPEESLRGCIGCKVQRTQWVLCEFLRDLARQICVHLIDQLLSGPHISTDESVIDAGPSSDVT
jgi:hypothetical protein